MSSIFETVKAAVTPKQVAAYYGIQVNRSDMLCCPFHQDRHPSLKLYDDHFFCFGCHKHGDVIDFAAELLGLPLYEAACQLADVFGVDPSSVTSLRTGGTFPRGGRQIRPKKTEVQQFRDDQEFCQRVLGEYLRLLWEWKERFAPSDPNAEPDDRFVEACQMYDVIDYLTELLIVGSLEQRVKTVDSLMADGKIAQLEERLTRLRMEANEGE